ncbi:type II secretion system F family protein [Thauera sp. CAU 1555]|uniref:Type II secretion system F family protein n=1 Tax=Thauera sedimentorum TaxID=2767595 RepID=A0ABR9B5N4_9RHOO|nr:type II secretion system F family protein [Thauera sedimentorum]MBC9070769.1 type II secretion system F family protein [Thauera sedimentorum]MBD8501688.1 type II secretion system F family protein [Thauera sedimentorum]
MNEDTLVIMGLALAAGLAIALLAWSLGRAVAEVPDEDREYKDPPPLGFRLVWWPIQWISYYLEPLLPAKQQTAVMGRLRKAGLDYALRPAQFVAARLVVALLAGGLFYWLLDSFDPGRTGGEPFADTLYWQAGLCGALFGWLYPAIWLRDTIQSRRRELLKALPFFLDIITLCVEAGLNFQGALHQAVLKGPRGVLRDEFQRVLRDVRAGKPRAEALRTLAQRVSEGPVTNFVASVIQAERLGMNLGPVLRAQADQQRVERFLRAEKLAMEAPVKMLFPLIAFIFPCTFIVLFFPIVVRFMEAGI